MNVNALVRKSLLRTTALIGAALVASQAAQAANITINTPTAVTQNLAAGDNLTVIPTGSITAAPAVAVSFVAAGFIDNSGAINGTGSQAIHIVAGDLTGGLTNNGTIHGSLAAVRTQAGADISGGLTNNLGGVISGTFQALRFQSGSHISGAINNSGTISGGFSGIDIQSGSDISGGVVNHASGTIAGGIGIFSGSSLSGGITNDGLMSGGSIRVGGGNMLDSGIHNNAGGTISSGITLSAGATVTGGILNSGSIKGGVSNAGTISGLFGVYSGNGGDISAAVNNSGLISGGNSGFDVNTNGHISGTVTNSAGGTIEGVYGFYVGTGSDMSGGVINQSGGTIAGTSYGFFIANGGDVSGGIDNFGFLRGVTRAINVVDSTLSGGIDNEAGGTIDGNTAICACSTADLAGGITNHGTIVGHSGAAILVSSHADISGGIDNFGAIHSISNVGMLLQGGSTLSGGLINEAGAVISAPDSALAVVNSSDVTGAVQNSGTITGLNGVFVFNNADISGGIVNKSGGIISGANLGIKVQSNGDISGGVANQAGGTITGGIEGILVTNGSHLSGGVSNNGVIAGLSTGISVFTNSDVAGGITNSGTIASTGFDAIQVFKLSDVGGPGIVNNAGATLSGGHSGVLIAFSADVSGGIHNSGTIAGGLSNGIEVEDFSDVSGGIHNSGKILGATAGIEIATVSDISGGIDNQSGGIISSAQRGILLTSASDISGGINNHANATISGGWTGIVLSNSSHMTGMVDNSGTITGSFNGMYIGGFTDIAGGIVNESGARISGGGWGVSVGTAGDISGGIVNRGVITGGGPGIFANGLDISGGVDNQSGGTISGGAAGISVGSFNPASNISGGVTNSGLITGPMGIEISNAKISGGITNSAGGTIDGTGGTAINLFSLHAATPITINGGRIIGDVIDSAPANGFSPVTIGGDFATEGNFNVSALSVASGKTLTVGGGDTVTLNHMAAGAGGTLQFAVNNDTTGFGKLVVNGAGQGINLTGETVKVTVGLGAAIADGDELKIGDGAAAIVGGPGAVKTTVADDSLLWDFSMADGTAAAAPTDDTDLFLFVTASVAPVFATPGNAAAFSTLQGLAATTDPQLMQIVGNVNNAPTQAALNEVLEAVQPSVNGGARVASLTVSDASLDLVSSWLDEVEDRWNSGVASGNAAKELAAWGQVFGEYAHQQSRDGIAGFRASTGGFAMGMGTDRLLDKAVLGAAVSYGRTDARSENATRTQEGIDDYQFTVYGDFDLGQKAFLRGMAAYVRGAADTTRHDVGGIPGVTARGSYDSNQYTARAQIGRGYDVHHFVTLTPNATADWTHFDPGDYTERGAGGADLHVVQDTTDIFEIGPGVNVDWTKETEGGDAVSLDLDLGYRYDLVGDRVESTSAFTGGGAAFTSLGADPARSRFDVGTGVTYVTTNNWELKARYDFDARSGYYSHSGMFRGTYKFY